MPPPQNMIDCFQPDASPPESRSYEFGIVREQMIVHNRLALMPMWADGWKWGGDPALSKSEGQMWVTQMPGVSNLTGGRVLNISKKSKKKEAAYKVLAYFADPEVTVDLVNNNATWLDPWRKTHVQPEIFSHLCKTDFARCENFVYNCARVVEQGYPTLNIRGMGKYFEVIDRWSSAAIKGEATAHETVDGIVKEFDEITDGLGRKEQAAEFQEFVDKILKPRGLWK